MSVRAAPQIIVANGSLRSAGFRERVLAAREAGFDGFGIHVRDYAHLRSTGWTDADLRAVLRDNGFDLIEIETVLGWDDPPERRNTDGLHREQLAFELADAVGARHVMAVGALTGEPRETAAEGFAGLCERAADHGLLVALEPQACSTIADLRSAVAIVRTAGRPNGGLNLDIWHATRGAWPRAELAALNGHEIMVVQIDDGPMEPVTDDYLAECTHYRTAPGEGEFDIAGFLSTAYGTGTTAPVSVEVMSDELDDLPVQTAAVRPRQPAASFLGRADVDLGAVFPTTQIGTDPAVIRDVAQTADRTGVEWPVLAEWGRRWRLRAVLTRALDLVEERFGAVTRVQPVELDARVTRFLEGSGHGLARQ